MPQIPVGAKIISSLFTGSITFIAFDEVQQISLTALTAALEFT